MSSVRRIKLLILGLLLFPAALFAQTSVTGRIDEGPLAARPTVCNIGDYYVSNDTNPVVEYKCSVGNAWNQESGGGGTPGGIPIQTQVNNTGVFGGTPCETFDALNTGPERLTCDNIITGLNPYIDIRSKGARTCNPTVIPCASGITATITSGTNSASVSNSNAFRANDGVVIYGAGPATTMTAPTGLTVTPRIAIDGTGTGLTYFSATASTTRCYKIIASGTGGGFSAASSEVCTTTGQPTLGAVTVNLTSCSRSGNSVTCTTASPHPVFVGSSSHLGEVYIGAGTSDASFRGFYELASASDSTHFTFTNSTVSTSEGGSTSSTGGAATFYLCDELLWSPVTGAWLYYIYEGASGAETLVGVSRPNNAATGNTDTSFDYFGSTFQGSWVFPPWIPTTPPAGAQNDNLSTTVTSTAGGGATLNLAANAGATVTNATIRLDAGPAILAAAAASDANAPVYIPNDPSGNPFVINSFTDLRPYRIALYQSGSLFLNQTLAIGFQFAPVGTFRWTGGQNTAYGFNAGFGPVPQVTVKEASPGVYSDGGNSVTVDGVQFNSAVGNNALLFLSDCVGGAFNENFKNSSFSSSTSSGDLMGFGLILRSCSGIWFDKVNFGNGAGGDGTSHNTPFFCNNCGDVHIQTAYMVHRGINYYAPNGNGTIALGDLHYNGGGTPLVTSYGTPLGVFLGGTGGIIMDTVGHACVAAIFGTQTVTNNGCAPGGTSFVSPSVTGQAVQYVTGGGGPIVDTLTINTTIPSTRESDGAAVVNSAFAGPGAITVSPLDSVLVNNAIPAIPTCVVSTSGSMAVGTYTFIAQPQWGPNLSEGAASFPSTGCTTSTGNQTITVNFTTIPGNPSKVLVFGSNGGTYGLACTVTPPATSCIITSSTFGGGINNFAPQGGPTMLLPGVQGVLTPTITISSCNVSGQALTAQNGSSMACLSPGLPDGNGGVAVTTTPYTVQCDSGTTLLDRAALVPFAAGSSVVTVPLSTAAGCTGHFVFSAVNQNAGTLTFNRTSPDTFNVYTGSNYVNGTSFTLQNGQYVTLNQGPTGVWEVRITAGTGVGAGAMALGAGIFALSNFCPQSNTGNCYFTPANTQTNNNCTWGTGSATITCGTQSSPVSGSVNASNVATYSLQTSQGTPSPINTAWAIGDSVTVLGFTGADTFFNQTCTLTAVTTSSVSCALTHAAASSTTSGMVVNTTKGPFVTGDVGKLAWGAGSTAGGAFSGGCDPYQPQPIAAFITATHSTIATYISSTQITLNANPTNAFTTPVSGGCFIWGNTDDTGAAAVDAALQVSTSCPRLELQAGYYLFTAPHFFTTPRACQEHPNVFDSIRFGNIFFAAGFEWSGRGPGPTTVFIPPDFPESGSCTNGYKANACFTVTGEGRIHDLTITGGANGGMPTNTVLMAVGVGSLEYFNCTGVGANVSGTYGVEIQVQGQVQQVNVNACGNSNVHVDASTGNVFAGSPIANAKGYRLSADNAIGADIWVDAGANFTCHSCLTFGTQNSAGASGWFNQGGTLWLDDIDSTQIAAVTGTIAVQTAYNSSGATSVLHCSRCRFGQGSVATQTNGIQCAAAATCNNYLEDSLLAATGTGKPYQDSSNALSTLFQIGQTTKFTGGGANSISGANRHIEVGTCTFAAATTCVVTFAQTFGNSGNVPAFTIPPNIVGTATTLTVSALSSSSATITASASNSGSVNWMAILQ